MTRITTWWLLGAFAVLGANCSSVWGADIVLTFDDVTSLSDYAPLGVSFSPNASLYYDFGTPTILEDPDGSLYDHPYGLQFGNAGGEAGQIYFGSDATKVSIWALSGVGPDPLSDGIYLKAYDATGSLLATANADPSLQFDLLTVSGNAIRRLETYSPVVNMDVWDHMVITVPEPSTLVLLVVGAFALLYYARPCPRRVPRHHAPIGD